MNRYTAGRIEGLLFASRKSIEIASEELRVATSGMKRFELGVKIGAALSNLLDISREIYAEHPQLNPFLEMEKATAEWQARLRRQNSRKKRSPSRR